MNAETLLEEVSRQADLLTPELLPMVLKSMFSRNGVAGCLRHETLLQPYVRAQIELTRAKRALDHCHHNFDERYNQSDANLRRVKQTRDTAHDAYHSTPCTCHVTKR